MTYLYVALLNLKNTFNSTLPCASDLLYWEQNEKLNPWSWSVTVGKCSFWTLYDLLYDVITAVFLSYMVIFSFYCLKAVNIFTCTDCTSCKNKTFASNKKQTTLKTFSGLQSHSFVYLEISWKSPDNFLTNLVDWQIYGRTDGRTNKPMPK